MVAQRGGSASSGSSSTLKPAATVGEKVKICAKCSNPGHNAAQCPFSGTLAEINVAAASAAWEDDQDMMHTVAFASEEEKERKQQDARERFGKCRHCGQEHT